MSERLRILALFGSAVLFGQERGNIEVLAALKEEGCEVLCLVRDEAWSTLIPALLDSRGLGWRKVPYIEQRLPGRLPWVLFRNPFAFLAANWRFLKIVRQYRPTHIHAFNELYFLNFLIGIILVRSPMVYRAGDQPTLHRWYWRALWHLLRRRVDRFVANSQFVARSLYSIGIQKDRITVIYNMPPKRAESIALPSPPFPPNARNIVYIGQISEHKGIHLLVDAFRSLAACYPDARLLIAGRISNWSGDAWGQRLKERVASDPLINERVVFLGYIDDIPSLLEQSEVHVAPSLFNDPSPNVVMEAKLASRPSIVFPRGGLPELVEHNVDGFVCHEASASALAETLRRYLDDASLVHRHGRAAFDSLSRLGVPEFRRRWFETYATAGACQKVPGIGHEP